MKPLTFLQRYYTFGQSPQTENRLKKLIRIWRALHEYVNFVHDPEKQYRSLSTAYRPHPVDRTVRLRAAASKVAL